MNPKDNGIRTGEPEKNRLLDKREVIASRLRASREAAGLSQGQVARELAMHRPTISEIEAGRRRVSVEEITAFAQLYAVSVSWLSCTDNQHPDPDGDRLLLAARELSRLKPEDLNRLLALLETMRLNDHVENEGAPEKAPKKESAPKRHEEVRPHYET